MNYTECLNILTEWYEYHHGQCDDSTCGMAEAYSQGLYIYASKMLVDAIGIDKNHSFNSKLEKNAEKAYKRLTKKYLKRYKQDIDIEHKELLNVRHKECKHCNAVTWQPEFCGNVCLNCDTSL